MSAILELSKSLLPAATGTVAIIFSTISGIFVMNKTRYGIKGFAHPYKPWADVDDKEKSERAYRGYKANENQREWQTYTIPFVFLFNVYGSRVPYVGEYAGAATVVLSLIYAWFNKQYAVEYSESTDRRVAPFKMRTLAFKALAFGSMAAMAFAAYEDFGVAKLIGLQ